MHAVAAILGAYESSLQGKMITFDEIISEEVTLYQDEINKELVKPKKSRIKEKLIAKLIETKP